MISDYIDSVDDLIFAFDYDLSTGSMTARRTFAKPPPPLAPATETNGVFDGLAVDAVGNIWAARWKDQRVLGYKPDGTLFGQIRVPGCKSPTIPCFGGEVPYDFATTFLSSEVSSEERIAYTSGQPAHHSSTEVRAHTCTGKDLSTMYIATAHSKLANEGEIQDQFPHSGDLFSISLAKGSEAAQVFGLSDDWAGRERHRFGA
jgi:sugar lactone lactonase YvrE